MDSDQRTLTCPDCDRTFTGPWEGSGHVRWRLAVHRARTHSKRAESNLTARLNRLESTLNDLLDHLGLEEDR